MMVVAIDKGDANGRAAKRLGRVKPAKTTSDDDDGRLSVVRGFEKSWCLVSTVNAWWPDGRRSTACHH